MKTSSANEELMSKYSVEKQLRSMCRCSTGLSGFSDSASSVGELQEQPAALRLSTVGSLCGLDR